MKSKHNEAEADLCPRRKIVWGVCGIGNGHTFRQLPLIEHFSRSCTVVILAYGESLKFYQGRFADHRHVYVLPVVVPFYVGSRQGLDFEATANLEANKTLDLSLNLKTLARVQELVGKPDLVVSDYEPVSAQYAYGTGAPLVTIDQQSKYLRESFPEELDGHYYADEIARLKLFFPAAQDRLAVSFFDVAEPLPAAGDSNQSQLGFQVKILPPVIKASVEAIKERRSRNECESAAKGLSLLVYASSQKDFPQAIPDMLAQLALLPEVQFQVFLPAKDAQPLQAASGFANVQIYQHGDAAFDTVLASADGIVTTAGHTLLSEAMYLGLPAYVIPLAVYEQVMNAEVIRANSFGLQDRTVNAKSLRRFVQELPQMAQAIASDKKVLLRGSGLEPLLQCLEGYLSAKAE